MTNFRQIDERLLPSVQYTTPATGNTITANDTGRNTLLINPAGTLATLTINLNGTPLDGELVTLSSSQIVTSLTMANGTIVGALTALAVASFATYTYSATASKWFRTA